MPDIDKINLVSVDSIEKLNSILKANIASINGMVVVSGVGEPAAAYSMRLLGEEVGISSYTGPAVRVRRTGDDVEADVAFDSGEITLSSAISNTTASETTFGDFVGHGGTPVDAFVDTWYDQSSNANHAEQATPGSQPQIYDATNGLITENGKPAIGFDNFGSVLVAPNASSLQIIGNLFAHVVTAGVNETSFGPLFTKRVADNQREYELRFNSDTQVKYLDSANNKTYSISSSSNQRLFVLKRISNTSAQLFENGTSISTQALSGTQSTTTAGLALGGREDGLFNLDGTLQEIVLWPSQQTDNRTAIEDNINDHFLIDNFSSPTSGFLGTYTDAAAAYSVRKLANTASKSMRILVDSDANGPDGSDPTYDIGFNADGSLDVAAIEAYCNNPSGTNYDAYVVTWYDQSGEGNHATQSTFTSCPKIADAGVVITENGKPALDFDGSGDNLQYTGNFLGGSAATGVSVSSFDNATRTSREIIWGAQDSSGSRYDFLIARQASNAPTNVHVQNGIDLYVEGDAPGNTAAGTITDTNQHLMSSIYSNNTRRIIYNNGSALSTWTDYALGNLDDATAFLIGADIQSASNSMDGKMQEIVIWNADQEADSNRTAIEENINSEYLIYQPTTQPTSGLLYDYGSATGGTDAAAAYSVRQLSDKAVLCMRIRRDMGAGNPGDDDETNIGFDANGDLDTQAIADFCGTGTGWVTRWWDQSVNSNHAEQDGQGSQAQIYNGTAVVTENGKPALNFDDVGIYNAGNIVTDDITVSIVCTAVNTPTTVGGLLAVQNNFNQGYEIIYITQDTGRWAVKNSDLNVTFTEDQQYHVFTSYDGTTQQFAINGTNNTQASSQTFSLSYDLVIGGRQTGATGSLWGGTIQEVVVYDNATYADTTNRNGIETDVDTYFSIT